MAALLALFIRSLRDDMRSKALLWARTGMAVAVLFAVFKARVFRFANASGLEFFESLVWMNVVFIVVAGVSYFASAITEEKEEGTLGLLRMTDLNPLAILLGKSTSRFVGGALMLLVQLPFALLAITLGGVHINQVLGSYAILLAMLFFACSAGLLASVIAPRTGSAGVLGGVLMLAWGLVMLIVDELCGSSGGTWIHPSAGTPLAALSELFGVTGPQFPIAGQCVWLVGGGLFAFAAGLAGFNRYCTEDGDAHSKQVARTGINEAEKPRATGGFPRRAAGDAIAWRDFHFLHGSDVAIVFKSILYLIGATMVLAAASTFNTEAAFLTLLILSLIVIAIESTFAASRVFRIERKDKTLAALMILPMDYKDLIKAKRKAVLRSLTPALVALGISSLVLIGPLLRAIVSDGMVLFYTPQVILFVVAQFYFNLRLVAWFSLRMKWGGLPTALALSWIANSIVIFFTALIFQSAAFFVLITGTIAASVKLKHALRQRIEQAAAEE